MGWRQAEVTMGRGDSGEILECKQGHTKTVPALEAMALHMRNVWNIMMQDTVGTTNAPGRAQPTRGTSRQINILKTNSAAGDNRSREGHSWSRSRPCWRVMTIRSRCSQANPTDRGKMLGVQQIIYCIHQSTFKGLELRRVRERKSSTLSQYIDPYPGLIDLGMVRSDH